MADVELSAVFCSLLRLDTKRVLPRNLMAWLSQGLAGCYYVIGILSSMIPELKDHYLIEAKCIELVGTAFRTQKNARNDEVVKSKHDARRIMFRLMEA